MEEKDKQMMLSILSELNATSMAMKVKLNDLHAKAAFSLLKNNLKRAIADIEEYEDSLQ